MNPPETQLLRLAKDFVRFQQSLLTHWINANSSSCDLEMLLDFPKRCNVSVDSKVWQAMRHGLGVRFVSPDGLTIDVPIAVNRPNAFDSGRLFDFVVSLPPDSYEFIPRNRVSFCEVFDRLFHSGLLKRQVDSRGRQLFAIDANNCF